MAYEPAESISMNQGASTAFGLAPPTTGDYVSYAIGALVVAGAIVLAFKRLRKWALLQLAAHRTAASALKWWNHVVLVALLAILFDKIDVSEVLSLSAGRWDLVAGFLLIISVVLYLSGIRLEWQHEAASDIRAQSERQQLQLAQSFEAQLKKDLDSQRLLSRLVMSSLGERWGRIKKFLDECREGRVDRSLERLSSIVNPNAQFAMLLQQTHAFIRTQCFGGLEPEYQLRIAYYEPQGDQLRCVASFDGNRSSCIQTPNGNLSSRFKLTVENSASCLAVYCALQAPAEPVMIEDADEAHADQNSPYTHLSNTQRGHIRSIAAYCCRGGGTDAAPFPVITIDSTKPRHFKDTSAAKLALRLVLEECAMRLAYERDLQELLDAVSSSSVTEATNLAQEATR